MTMMVTEVYGALLAAGAPEDKAARAAQALAGYDNRSNKVETEFDHRFSRVESDFNRRFDKVEADLRLLKWRVGLVVAGIVALITKTFF